MAGCSNTQILEENPSLLLSLFRTMCGASVTLSSIKESLLHGGNLEISIYVVFPDLISDTVSFTYPGFNQSLRNGYMFTINGANLNTKTCTLTVATESCISEGQGTLEDTRLCCGSLVKNPSTGICERGGEPPPPPPPGTEDNSMVYAASGLALLVGGYLILKRK